MLPLRRSQNLTIHQKILGGPALRSAPEHFHMIKPLQSAPYKGGSHPGFADGIDKIYQGPQRIHQRSTFNRQWKQNLDSNQLWYKSTEIDVLQLTSPARFPKFVSTYSFLTSLRLRPHFADGLYSSHRTNSCHYRATRERCHCGSGWPLPSLSWRWFTRLLAAHQWQPQQ